MGGEATPTEFMRLTLKPETTGKGKKKKRSIGSSWLGPRDCSTSSRSGVRPHFRVKV